MHMAQNQDIEALVDNELTASEHTRVRAYVRQNKAAQKQLETLQMQKLMLIYWFEMSGQAH